MRNGNQRVRRRTEAVDGTTIELRELPGGRYQVTDGDGNAFEDPVRTLDRAIEQFNETERFVSRGARSQQSRRPERRGFGGGFGGFGGDAADEPEPLLGRLDEGEEGGFFGQSDDDDNDGLFGGFL